MPMSPRLLRPRAAGGFDPRSISGCICNLDASVVSSLRQNSDGTTAAAATDDPVGYWADLSGLSNHATQSVATGSRPFLKLNNQNGLPGLLFDGSNDWLEATIAGFQSLSNVTIIQVVKTANAAAADTNSALFWGFGNLGAQSGSFPQARAIAVVSTTGVFAGEFIAPAGNVSPPTQGRLGSTTYRRAANAAQMIISSFGANGTTLSANDASASLDLSSEITTATATGPSATGFTVDNIVYILAIRNGASVAVTSEATLHQMIVYDRILTAAERTAIWNAMRGKWGIT